MAVSEDKHVISILLENEAGALSRVAGLFSVRGYNIDSLTVARTKDPALSRMTIVTMGSGNLVRQVMNQLSKLVDIISVQDLSCGRHVEREMLLLKLQCRDDAEAYTEVRLLAELHGASMVEAGEGTCVLELMTSPRRIDEFISAWEDDAVVDVVRSGVVSTGTGADVLKD